MDEAMTNRLQRIVFIHGVGNGRLKTEVIKILSECKGIRFQDASYQRYGYGATEVVFTKGYFKIFPLAHVYLSLHRRLFRRCSAMNRGKSGQHRAACFLTGRGFPSNRGIMESATEK